MPDGLMAVADMCSNPGLEGSFSARLAVGDKYTEICSGHAMTLNSGPSIGGFACVLS